MNVDDIFGYKDQEILIQAFVLYLTKHLNEPQERIAGFLRVSIAEWALITDINIRDIKSLDEKKRDEAVEGILEVFFNKLMSIEKNPKTRKLLEVHKNNCMRIYENWKEKWRENIPSLWASGIGEFTKP